VGGHCIGVDPYYLTTKAEELGYHPQVILAGRQINDGMGVYLGQRLIKLLVHSEVAVKGARVGVLGITFKENVPDIRNSRVPDIIRELKAFGITPLIHDPLANAAETEHEYGLRLADWDALGKLDAVILAVAHTFYREQGAKKLLALLKPGGVFMDIKSLISPSEVPERVLYWSL